MKLIIAEKPSLARNIVAAVGNMTKQSGFYSGKDYIVTWALGHLFGLCDIEDYLPEDRRTPRWEPSVLPCFPEKFVFRLRRDPATKEVDAGVRRQFETVKALCNREDVEGIVNAGDSDREGEIIIRILIDQALESPKPVFRLWLPDQTDVTIREGLDAMESDSKYDSLADEGFARTYIDWLYGVNLTRYATLKTGTLLRVGRVIVPVVKAIYDRDLAIRDFVPEKYWCPVSKTGDENEAVELVSKKRFDFGDRSGAQALCDAYNAAGGVVTEVKKKKETLSPGKLYSLSKLQNFLGKKYKMSMTESLDLVQKLYEAGWVTYPRTNSEYVATKEKDKIKAILANVKKLGYPVEFKDKKTIFDDSKIESHSALTPTYKIPDKNALSERETLVYSAILRRFVAVFCAEDCLIDRTELKIDVGGMEEFVLKGAAVRQAGWTAFDSYTPKDKFLPALSKGDRIETAFAPAEKETSPPKHYTIETLNNYLKNPFREDKAKADEEDDEDYRAIFEGLELGTEATRTGIIDNARKSGYITLKNDVYTIERPGEFLIESLADMNISMDKYKTSQLGQALKKVYRGEITVEDSLDIAKAEIREVIRPTPDPKTDTGYFGETVGKCPLCGEEVTVSRFGYSCRGYKTNGCRLSIPRRFCGRIIPKTFAAYLLEHRRAPKRGGFVSKAGKPFEAVLELTDEGKVRFVFDN